MDILDEVFGKAESMLRESLPDGSGEVLKEMCRAAVHELSHRLSAEFSVEDIRGQFVRAAATLGLSLYIGLDTERGAESFSAGSIRVERRTRADVRASSESLRRQAELMLTGFLSDGGFAFRAVRA